MIRTMCHPGATFLGTCMIRSCPVGKGTKPPEGRGVCGAKEQYPYGIAVKSEEVQEMLFLSEIIYRRI